jgi:hypothetical protein
MSSKSESNIERLQGSLEVAGDRPDREGRHGHCGVAAWLKHIMGTHQVVKPRTGRGVVSIGVIVLLSGGAGSFALLRSGQRGPVGQGSPSTATATATATATVSVTSTATAKPTASAASTAHSTAHSTGATQAGSGSAGPSGLLLPPSADLPQQSQGVNQPPPTLPVTSWLITKSPTPVPATKSVSLTCPEATTLQAQGSGSSAGNVLAFGGTTRQGSSVTIKLNVGPGTYAATDTDPGGSAALSLLQVVATANPCHG